ncbi:MAG: hypothetical protein ABIA74_06430 [bacterium]
MNVKNLFKIFLLSLVLYGPTINLNAEVITYEMVKKEILKIIKNHKINEENVNALTETIMLKISKRRHCVVQTVFYYSGNTKRYEEKKEASFIEKASFEDIGEAITQTTQTCTQINQKILNTDQSKILDLSKLDLITEDIPLILYFLNCHKEISKNITTINLSYNNNLLPNLVDTLKLLKDNLPNLQKIIL